MVAGTDDRGQLLLAGSITIAVILIGLTIILNSVVFTENIAGGSTVETTGDVSEFNKELRRNARSLTIRIAHGKVYEQQSDLEDDVARNFTNYSRVLAEAYADTGSVYANVTYDETKTVGGRVTQDPNRVFTKEPGGLKDWSVFSDVKELGWFVMNVDVSNVSSSGHFYVEVTDTSGSALNVSMRRSPGGSLLVNSSVDGSHVSNATCAPESGRVLLDIIDGTSFTSDCTFNSTEHLDQPYQRLEFVNGDNGYGRYSLVVNETSPLTPTPCTAPNEPCRGPAIWEIQFTTRYETGAITYENTQNVTVYEDA